MGFTRVVNNYEGERFYRTVCRMQELGEGVNFLEGFGRSESNVNKHIGSDKMLVE